MPLSHDPTSARERSELLALDELHSDPPEWLAWNEWATENYPLEDDPMHDPRTPAYLIREAYGHDLRPRHYGGVLIRRSTDRYQRADGTTVQHYRVGPRGPFAREQRAIIAADRAVERTSRLPRTAPLWSQRQRDRSGPNAWPHPLGYTRIMARGMNGYEQVRVSAITGRPE